MHVHMYVASRCVCCTVHGKILAGENFGESHRYKLLARKKLANKLRSVHMPHIFLAICEYCEENFGE